MQLVEYTMHYHKAFTYDPNQGPLTVKLVAPRAAAQLDLWTPADTLFSDFSVNHHDPHRNREQVWSFDPNQWSAQGNVLECWGIFAERRLDNGESFSATVEVHQAGELILAVTREFTVEDDDTSFHIRMKFVSNTDEDEIDYFDLVEAMENEDPKMVYKEFRKELSL